MRFNLFLIFLISIAFSFSSCSLDDDNDNRPSESLADLISEDSDYEMLEAALEAAGLLDDLDNSGLNTILAPTDDAFNSFLDGRDFSDIPTAELSRLLLVHIVLGELTTQDLVSAEEGYVITSSLGPVQNSTINLYFKSDNGIEISGRAKIIDSGSNRRASNGVLHQIDAILELPTLSDFIAVDDRLKELEEASTSAGQPDFISLFDTPNGEEPAPFTVFAPTNTAFDDFGELPTGEALTAVLEHHVIAAENILFGDLEDDMKLTTVEGGDLTIRVLGTNQTNIIDGSDNGDSRIIGANIQASNGVLHFIDGILVPNTTN